ncbi:MAG: hypothetical protein LQ342_004813 [Letrouitia transgressa]|nr:MAG: hypothetical protein LQ342_004813 [Letrouitia transgressa]
MLDRLKPGSLLSMALLVVSYSLYAAWDPNIRNGENTETQVAYANAIRALRAALSDPEECVSDETLMAVCILGYYEAIVDTYMSRPPTMQHYSGAAAIIKKRQSITMTSELSKRLLLAARSHLVFKALQTSSFIDQAPELWQDPQEMLHSPAVSLDSLSVEVANVVATARNYSLKLSASSSNDTELASDKRRILLRAQAINARLLSWRKTVPSEWTPLRLSRHQTPTEIVNAGFYGDYCDIYPELPVCRIWNDWRARRLKVLLLIAKFDDGGPATIAILDIYQVIGDIFASVPFALGSKTEASTICYGRSLLALSSDDST